MDFIKGIKIANSVKFAAIVLRLNDRVPIKTDASHIGDHKASFHKSVLKGGKSVYI